MRKSRAKTEEEGQDRQRSGIKPEIWMPVIGTLIATIGGIIGIMLNNQQAEIRARQELLPTISALETKIAEPIPFTGETIITQIVEVTSTPPPTQIPPPYPIDVKNWQRDFCDDRCGSDYGTSASSIIVNLVPGRTNDAVEVLYDVKNSGWVLIKKNITPDLLSGTKGISFFYKGIGAPNSIELKLLLHYPGDGEDTTFGVLLGRATDTGVQWKSHEALYEVDFECWGPAALCQQHDNAFDLDAVHRIEFGIANKAGDTVGLGKVAFADIAGIPR